jgi:hypothetical protein
MDTESKIFQGGMVTTPARDSIILTPQPDPATGQAVYTLPARVRPTMRDLTLIEGGKIAAVPGSRTRLIHISRLPQERMAATWEDIAQTLRTAEDGRPGVVDVELRPGGELVLTGREQPAQPLSQLPKGRMAWLPPS